MDSTTDVTGSCNISKGAKYSRSVPWSITLHHPFKAPAPREVPGHSYLNLTQYKPNRWWVLGIFPLLPIWDYHHHLMESVCNHPFDQQTSKIKQPSLSVRPVGGEIFLLFSFSFLYIFLSDTFMLTYCHIAIDNNNQSGYIPIFLCNQIVLQWTLHVCIYKHWSFSVLSL